MWLELRRIVLIDLVGVVTIRANFFKFLVRHQFTMSLKFDLLILLSEISDKAVAGLLSESLM
jgi:hypothetical protein